MWRGWSRTDSHLALESVCYVKAKLSAIEILFHFERDQLMVGQSRVLVVLLCLGFPLKEKGSVGSKVGTLSCCLAHVRCQTGAGDRLMAVPAHPHRDNCNGQTDGGWRCKNDRSH